MRTKGAVTAKGEKKLGKKLGKNLGRNLGRSKTPKTPLSEEGSFRVCEAYPSPCPFRVLILSESLSFPSPYSIRVPVLSESLFFPSLCTHRYRLAVASRGGGGGSRVRPRAVYVRGPIKTQRGAVPHRAFTPALYTSQ